MNQEEGVINNIYYFYYQTRLGNTSYYKIFDYIINYNETKVNNLYVYSKIFELYKILINPYFMTKNEDFKKVVGDILKSINNYECGIHFVNELNYLFLYYLRFAVHVSH